MTRGSALEPQALRAGFHRGKRHWVGPGYHESLQSYGSLTLSRDYSEDRFCHIPGLAIGVASGAYTRNLAKASHNQLCTMLEQEDIKCGSHYHGIQCIDFITTFDQCALRSQTPTVSAP